MHVHSAQRVQAEKPAISPIWTLSMWDLILITEHFELHPWPCELDSSQIPSWHEVGYK